MNDCCYVKSYMHHALVKMCRGVIRPIKLSKGDGSGVISLSKGRQFHILGE